MRDLERVANHIIDGGGIRGLSTLFILRRLMEEIQHLEDADEVEKESKQAAEDRREAAERNQKATEASEPPLGKALPKPCHYFDLMVGTSTGGYVRLPLR